LHRPRQSVVTLTSNTSPPWPQYLVIRSPSFPDGQFIPLIDVDDDAAKGKAKEDDEDSLKFSLSIPTRPSTNESRVRSSRPAQLDLTSHSTLSINDDEEEEDPLTPTTAKPNLSKPVKKSRPKSATYRVDMTPSLSQDSATSSTSEQSTSSAVTDTSLTSQDPLSTSTPPPAQSQTDTTASFFLQPSLNSSLLIERERTTPTGFGKRVFGKLRSLVVEEGKTWSCIWEKPSESSGDPTSAMDEKVIMYFEEDPPSCARSLTLSYFSSLAHHSLTRYSLFPSPMKGTLSLSEELVDKSGYEPSFWVTVAMGWMECQGEREGWRESRGGD